MCFSRIITMKWLQIFLVLFAIVSFASAAGTINFYITNTSGTPLNGVNVVLSQSDVPIYTRISDISGYANFTSINAGTYNYLISANNYVNKEGSITIIDNSVSTMPITLTLASQMHGTLQVCVYTQNNTRITANVDLNGGAGTFQMSVIAPGCATRTLPPGTYTAITRALGYQSSVNGGIVLAANGFQTHSVTLQPDGSMNGTIIFNITNGSSGVTANVEINGMTYVATNGQLTISLENGVYPVTISANGYETYLTSIGVSAQQTTRQNIVINQIGTLSLMVYNSSNIPLDNVNAIITGNNVTNVNFNKNIQLQLRPGNYQLIVNRDGYVQSTTNFIINASQTTPVNVIMLKEAETKVGTLAIRVKNADTNANIHGAEVRVTGPTSFTAITDSNGMINPRIVMAGQYTINASALNYDRFILSLDVPENQSREINVSLRYVGNMNYTIQKTILEAREKLNITINTSQRADFAITIYSQDAIIEQSSYSIIGTKEILKGPYSPGKYSLTIERTVGLLNGSNRFEHNFEVLKSGVIADIEESEKNNYEKSGCLKIGTHKIILQNTREVDLWAYLSYASSESNVEVTGESQVYLSKNETRIMNWEIKKIGNTIGSFYVTLKVKDNMSGYDNILTMPVCTEEGVQLVAEMNTNIVIAKKGQKTCQRAIIRNADDYLGDNILFSVSGAYDPIVYPERMYVGPRGIETVDVCITVPENAVGTIQRYELSAYSKKLGSSKSILSFEIPVQLFEINAPTTCLNYGRDVLNSHLIVLKNLGEKGNYEVNIRGATEKGIIAILSNQNLFNIEKNEQRQIYLNLLPSQNTTAGNHQIAITVSENKVPIATREICITTGAEYDVYVSSEYPTMSGKIGEYTNFILKLTNTGTVENEYTMSYSGTLKNVQLSPNKVKIKPGETADVTVSVMPINSTITGRYILRFGVLGNLVTKYLDINFDVERKTLNANIITESTQGWDGIVINMKVTNNEATTDEFKPVITNLPVNWTYTAEPTSAKLAPGETKEFILRVTPGSNYSADEEYLLNTEVYSGNKVAANSVLIPKKTTGLFLGFGIGKTNVNALLPLMTIMLLLIGAGIVLSYKIKVKGGVIKKR